MRLNENYAFNVLASFFFFNSKEGTEIPAENYETVDCTTNFFFAFLQHNISYLSAFSVHDFSYLFIIIGYNGRCNELLISNTIPNDPLCSNLINKLRAPVRFPSFATKNSFSFQLTRVIEISLHIMNRNNYFYKQYRNNLKLLRSIEIHIGYYEFRNSSFHRIQNSPFVSP